MTSALSILLCLYSVLLGANTIISILLLKTTKERLFGPPIMIWGFSFLNFLLQGIFQEPGILLLTAFGSYVLVSFSMLHFCVQMQKIEKIKPTQIAVSAAFFLASYAIWMATHNFTWSALAMSASISLPLFQAAYLVLRNQQSRRIDIRIFSVLLVANGLHFLDYPFLRFHPEGGLWGYSIAMLIIVMLSIFIPAFVTNEVSLRYSGKLEEDVAAKTRELTELSEMNRALLNIVCHDLATPLTVLQVASKQLFMAASETERNNQAFKQNQYRVETSLNGIKEILTKVRNLQSFRSGKTTLALVPIHPMRTLTETLILFEDRLKDKNINIEIENRLADTEHFLGDYTIVKHQILGNLISNAVKFSPRGSSIVIVITQEDGKGVIEVKDNGIGIPAKLLPQIFDFHVPTTRPGTENESGTGFGLPLVKTCVELMGGKIEVLSQSTVGTNEPTGTTFRIHMNRVAS